MEKARCGEVGCGEAGCGETWYEWGQGVVEKVRGRKVCRGGRGGRPGEVQNVWAQGVAGQGVREKRRGGGEA